MFIDKITTNQFFENVWIIGNETSQKAIIIDPGAEPDKIIESVSQHRLNPVSIICTHAHPDHISAVHVLQTQFKIPCFIHKNDTATLDMAQVYGQTLGLGFFELPENIQWIEKDGLLPLNIFRIYVLHTPGHTPGSICLLIDNYLFSGDTLFAGSVGRVDLPGSSWQNLKKSLEKLTALPDDTIVCPGHGEQTTIGAERKTNPYMKTLINH